MPARIHPLRLRTSTRLACAVALLAATAVAPAVAQSTMVRLHTTQGPIDVQLHDNAAPKTVANFLDYVRRGAYTETFIHRSMPGFVVQLGGYAWPSTGYAGHIATQPPVTNEFSAARSNLRGTVAMAKQPGNPDSATSEFFFNLGDNSGPCPKTADGREGLDCQNGGFTVFGRATAPGMAVVDRIAALATVNANGAFANLPVVNFSGNTILRQHVVRLEAATEFPPRAGQSESDRVFNWLEASFPEYLSPSRGEPGIGLGYTFRYYADTGSYIGTKDGRVYYLVPSISNEIQLLGDLSFWVEHVAGAGY